MRLASAGAFYGAVLLAALAWSALTPAGLGQVLAGPRELALPWWLAGLGTGLLLVAATAVAERHSAALRHLSDELGGLVAPATLPRVIALALLSGVCEEALFRGPLQQTVGLWLAALAFGLLHGGLSRRHLAWSLFALVAGICFGLLADVYGSVAPAAVAHVVVNGINLRRLGGARPPSTPTTAGQGTEDPRG